MNDFINIRSHELQQNGLTDWTSEARSWRHAIDARLAELCPAFSCRVPALGRAMTDAVTAPGKRFRGVLMAMLSARLGVTSPALIDAACAVELIHTASLVIDDLPAMDGAVLRRAQPTTHVAHGEARAILAGIALMSEAFRILSALPGVDGATRAEAVAVLAEAVGPAGLCGGQDLDLHDGKSLASVTTEQDLKTGQLFDAAFRIVAMINGCDEGQIAQLSVLSRDLGRAFQSYDDLLDVIGAGTGKTARRDCGASGPDKGLLAATGVEGAVHHYRAGRMALQTDFSSLWFDAQGVRDYVGAILPDDPPGPG